MSFRSDEIDARSETPERRIARLEAVSALSAGLIEAENEPDVFRAALEAIFAALGPDRASVLTFDEHGTMRFRAWRGVSEAYRNAVDGHSPWSSETRNAKPIVVEDAASDRSVEPFLSALQAEGIGALAFIPLIRKQRVSGKLMLYHDGQHHWTREELSIAELIAGHVAIGLDRVRQREALTKSYDELATVLEGITDAVIAQDGKGRLVYANQAAAKAVGFESADELLRSDPRWISARFELLDRGSERMGFDELLSTTRPSATETPERLVLIRDRETGSERWAMVRKVPVVNPSGGRGYTISVFKDVTESRSAERRLRRERNFLSRIIEELPVGVVIAEAPSGRILVLNGIVQELWPNVPAVDKWEDYGKFEGQFVEERVSGVEDYPLARALRGEAVSGLEMEIPRPEASPRIAAVSAAPIRDESGRVIAAVATVVDVTKERRADANSRFLAEAGRILVSSLEPETMLRAVAKLAVPVIADWCAVDLVDEEGVLRRLAVAHRDPEMVQRAEEVHRRYPPDLDSPHGIARVLRDGKSLLYPRFDDDMLRKAARNEDHYLLLQKIGFCSAMAIPLATAERVMGVITFASAESDRRFDQSDLELAEELCRRASLAISNSLLFQRESISRRAAEALQKLAGDLSEAATPERVAEVVLGHAHRALGSDASSIVVPDESRRIVSLASSLGYSPEVVERWRSFSLDSENPINAAIHSGSLVHVESLARMDEEYPDLGSERDYETTVAIPMQLESRVLGAIGLSYRESRPLTEQDRRHMIAVARQAAQALDRARLFEAEQEARAEAEAANRAKDEFLATLSHELRTPLTATLGWARMMTLNRLDEEGTRVAAESIHRSSQAQARIVDDLLEVSRIITGKMRLETQPVELEPIVRSAIDSVQSAARAKSIGIELEASSPTGTVSADPDRIRQVVWNLLSNAIKFTPPGGNVHVSVAPEGSSAAVVVRDTGQGIQEALLPHVFERFRQGESGAARSVGGLGLGLSIVKHLVELHGGEVHVESEGEGKGSTFTITLPLLDGSPGWRGRDVHLPDPGAELSGLNLLVVDDQKETLMMLRTILEKFGATVGTAGSADEALALLDERCHVLISDLAMPGRDGHELIREARRVLAGRPLITIALTAFGRPEDRECALQSGFDAYVRKPVEPERLIAAILEARGQSARSPFTDLR
jgi:PAS domain S-box-containing protein